MKNEDLKNLKYEIHHLLIFQFLQVVQNVRDETFNSESLKPYIDFKFLGRKKKRAKVC